MQPRSEEQPYTIVAAIDFGPPSDAAVLAALRIAVDRGGADLHVVHVIERSAGELVYAVHVRAHEVALQELPERMGEYVASLATTVEDPGRIRLGVHVRAGDAANVIEQLTADVQAHLLVVGTHGRKGLQRMMMGSVAEALVRSARCPVLVARPIDYEQPRLPAGVEPPCPECLRVRRQSAGRSFWCARHTSAAQSDPYTYSGTATVHWVAGTADVRGPEATPGVQP
jgi:nucleotide-binding universal stress UspA family protein